MICPGISFIRRAVGLRSNAKDRFSISQSIRDVGPRVAFFAHQYLRHQINRRSLIMAHPARIRLKGRKTGTAAVSDQKGTSEPT